LCVRITDIRIFFSFNKSIVLICALISETGLNIINLKKKKLAIVADHAGYTLKEKLLKYLANEQYEVRDFGSFSDESVDYPDYGHPLANAVSSGEFELGISICGTGNGINMVVNKHPGIRSALCWNEEISRLARAHNDANICALPGRFISESEAYLIVKTFLNTEFEGGRHRRRVDKIPLKMY
jgi:ribose 5-phosphate isomerase B